MSTYSKVVYQDGMTGEPPVDEAMESAKQAQQSEAGKGVEIPHEEPQYEDILADKFGGDVEKLAQAYSELERKLSSGGSADAPSEPAEMGDIQQYIDEFSETGEISESSREALEKIFPAALVDDYIEKARLAQLYEQTQGEQHVQQIYESVGGEQQYKQMVTWAAENLSKEEIEIFNDSVNGTQAQAQMAIEALVSKYSRAGGSKTPSLLKSSPQGAGGLAPYESVHQVTADMKKPEYRQDPAFRQQVHDRMRISNI